MEQKYSHSTPLEEAVITQETESANPRALRQGHRQMNFEAISWNDAVRDFLRQSLSAKEKRRRPTIT
ncbi:MAG: hypothetical protein M3Y28_07045 [Armatimonadota bacterium]|nr:hypothetical protein [Armatimonadota bacterium]